MKQNDWIALNLNIKDSNVNIDDLRAYNITPDNTGLKDKDYYKNIPQVINAFRDTDGSFNDEAFGAFYDSAQRSYNTFASDDYVKSVIESIPSSRNDIFAIGKSIRDNTAYVTNMRDPQRHTMGIGNIFEWGAPSFSEREVAQGNKVYDENGQELDWTPEDKGGLIKALFRPNLALATYEKDVLDENGNIIHQKGERMYNALGDPYYRVLGKNEETYGKDMLHYSDTLTREGSWANKYIDIYDRDGIENSPVKTLLWATAKMIPYFTPLGYAFGAIEATRALGETVPVMIKMLNGMLTNDTNSDLFKTATSVENFMSRFGHTTSDYGQKNRWGLEGIAQMVVDSAGQLYSQRLIPKIPEYLFKLKGTTMSVEAMKRAQSLSLAYMATTSAKEAYGDYVSAGLDRRVAGIGALGTMLAYYGLMQNDYFKDMIFRDSAIELPQLKIMLNKNAKAATAILTARQAENAGIQAVGKQVTKKASETAAKQWYKNVYNTVSSKLKEVIPALKNITALDSPYLYTSRAWNEGVEEVMEEGVSDFFKGMVLGLNELGVDVKDKSADKIDFGFSSEDFLQRYGTALVGGAIGGAVFEGLTQYDNKVLHRNINRVADLEDVDEQMSWYIRNGYKDELLKLIDQWEKKGKFGTKDLSWDYQVKDGKIVYNQGSEENNQNKAIANVLRQRVKYKSAQLDALGINISDNDILLKAMSNIKEEAEKAGYTDVEKYQEEKLRDARIDFLKETGVSRYIVTDIADLQKALTNLEDTIEQKKAEAKNVPDKFKDEVDENTPEIKRLQKQYDENKKRLDAILSGKAASEYLELGVFLSSKSLKDLYLSDLVEKDRTFAEKDVRSYTRIRYNENYDEMPEAVKEILNAEYNTWVDGKLEKKERVANALAIHKHLSGIITPIVQQQVADYYGYKREDIRMPFIVANLAQFQEKRLETMQEQLAKLMADTNADPQKIVELQSQIQNLENSLKQFSDPRQVLDTRPDTENDVINNYLNLFNESSDATANEILDATLNYYRQLNDGKIVSEFSDDILKSSLSTIGEIGRRTTVVNFDVFKKAGYDALNSFVDEPFQVLINTSLAKPEMQTITHEIIDSEGNTVVKSEAEILKDLLAYWDFSINTDGTGEFEYNGKYGHFFDHLQDENILSNLVTFEIDPDSGEDIEINPFSQYINNYKKNKQANYGRIDKEVLKEIQGLMNTFINSFNNGIDDILTSYENLENKLNSLIKLGQLNAKDGRSVIASILGADVIDSIKELKSLRANMIHTPILDWIQALSLQVRGIPTNLWQMLQDEVRGLESKTKLEQYVINDPFTIRELEFLDTALNAVEAINIGMIPGGTNEQINKLRKEEGKETLYTFDNEALSEVYDFDISVLKQRVNYLLDLHSRNFTGTVRQKKQSFIRNAPKFISKIVEKTSTALDEKDPPMFIAGALKNIGIDDVEVLWNEAGGAGINLSDVNENNFKEFWTAYRKFQNLIYDKVNAWSPKEGSKNKVIAKTLVSGFTDLWKFKTSELTHLEGSKLENFEILMWLASTIAVDPREVNGLIKTVKSTSKINPFFDQLLGIQTGYATLENDELFNEIVDAIWEEQQKVLDSLDIDDQDKDYLREKTRVYNAVFFDGASGTGKSTVELRYVRELRKLKHPDIAAIAVSEYEERTKALKSTLGIGDVDSFTKYALMEKLLGRKLTSDDFESHTEKGHFKVLKDSVKEELQKKTDIWKDVIGNRSGVDVYIDESGLLSEADFQFFNETIDANNVHFIYAGDEMQNGCLVETEAGINNSGVFDIMGIKTIRLNMSMRAGNLGMMKNLQHIETLLKQFLDVYKEEPWTTLSKLSEKRAERFGILPDYKFRFFEDENALFGVAFTDNDMQALEKLDRISQKVNGEPKVVVITDNIDKWQGKRSGNIDVLDVKSVQGGQYDYALIDVSSFKNAENFDDIRGIYTAISRAKKGVYIAGELGKAFPKTTAADMDSSAAIDINPTANNNDSDLAMEDYGEFFDDLYKEETWSSKALATVTTDESSASVTIGPITTPKAPLEAKKAEKAPGVPKFDLEGFLESIKKDGLKSPYLREWYSQTKNADYENYAKYFSFLNNNSQNGNALVTKDYIDWLFSDASDALLFEGQRSLLNGMNALTEEQKESYKELVKGLSMDLLLLSKEELEQKYVKNNFNLLEDWAGAGKVFASQEDRIREFFKTVPEAKTESGIELYSVRDGEYAYLYHVGNGFAIPVARIKGFVQEGGIKLDPSQHTPLILVSTNGGQFKPLKEVVGHYATISTDAYIPQADPEKIPAAKGSGVTEFVMSNRGKPMGLISATSNDYDDTDVMQVTMDENDPQRIWRIDSTEKFGKRKRLSGVSNWVSFTKWIELTKIIKNLKDDYQKVQKEDLNELKDYLKNGVWEDLQSIQGNPDPSSVFKSLAKLQLLSGRSRSLLTTALLRYFNSIKESDPISQKKFIDNISKWNAESYTSNDGEYRRQKCFTFAIEGSGSQEVYHVLLNSVTGKYEVRTKAIKDGVSVDSIVGELNPDQWLTINDFDPVKSTKALLELIRDAKNSGELKTSGLNTALLDENSDLYKFFNSSNGSLTDEYINSLLANGDITFGVSTRSETLNSNDGGPYNLEIRYFAPFDTDILDLLDGITVTEDGELDKFLKNDTKFKYQFLVNTPGEDFGGNPYWLAAKNAENLASDLGAVLPPLFEVGTVTGSSNSKFKDLGSLNHKLVTSDPKENLLYVIKNSDGSIKSWEPQKNFEISAEEFKKTTGLDVIGTKVVVVKATPNSVIIKEGTTTTERFTTKPITETLFKGMPETEGSVGEVILLDNGEQRLIKDDKGKLVIREKAKLYYPKVVYETDNRIGLKCGDRLIEFKKQNKERLAGDTPMFASGIYLGHTGEELSYGLWFLNKDKLTKFENDGTESYDIILTADGRILLKNDGSELALDPEIVGRIKASGLTPVKVNKKSDVKEAAMKLARNTGAEEFTGRTTKNANDWARKNAIALDGIFEYDEKQKDFIEDLSINAVVLINFAKWAKVNLGIDAQSVIDSNPIINILGAEASESNVAEITFNGETIKFTFAYKPNGKVELTRIIETDPSKEIPVINFEELINTTLTYAQLQLLTKKDFANLKLFLLSELGQDVNTNTEEFINWSNERFEELGDIMFTLTQAVKQQQQNKACEN